MVLFDLFLASFLALFLEVMLIRWVPSYERVLAYFTNFVLIAAFLGLGLGGMLGRARQQLMKYLPITVLALVTVALVFSGFVRTQTAADDVLYSEGNRPAAITLPLWLTLLIFFVLTTSVFIPLGQRIAEYLAAAKPRLRGYVVNLLGSVAGVLLFGGLSYFQVQPTFWFILVFALMAWLLRTENTATRVVAGAVGILTVVAVGVASEGFTWSPYHKLAVTPLIVDVSHRQLVPAQEDFDLPTSVRLPEDVGFRVAVDDDFLQMALCLTVRNVSAYPFLQNYQRQYDLPYSIPGFPYHDVLIVGAGTGNDTAAALRGGVSRVDAVEIDPAIVALGRRAHPEHPYDNPRVTIHVDDARSFFHTTTNRYDLVVFGLLDSHRLFSSMSSVRLDAFVFTEESFREVKALLKPNGLAIVQHGLGAPFIAARMYRILHDVFGQPPVILQIPEFPGLTYAVGPGLDKFLNRDPVKDVGPVEKATDDWPFFYLAGRQLPREYFGALAVMLLVAIGAVTSLTRGHWHPEQPHFFFLGASFLLIETLSVTRFGLLLGSTWVVNTVVFTAILLVVLLANLWSMWRPAMNVSLLYVLLCVSVLANYLFPMSALLGLGLALRIAAAMGLLALPLFFAALIFAQSYAVTPAADQAYAANLLGAVVGGLLEYSSMCIGFRALLLVALGLYVFSWITVRSIRTGPACAG